MDKQVEHLYKSSLIHVPASEIEINRQEVLRYLGYKPGHRPLRKKILNLLQQEEERARKLLNPRGLFCVMQSDPLRKQRIFSDAELVAFGIATIGSRLEEQVQRFFHSNEGIRGVMLDAIGSVAAEAVTDIINNRLNKWASVRGYNITRRFSPGYGPWDVRGQDLVFKHLGKFTAGVKLSSSRLMSPLKSVSFACKLGKGKLEEINEGRCTSCNMRESCAFRRNGTECSRAAGDG